MDSSSHTAILKPEWEVKMHMVIGHVGSKVLRGAILLDIMVYAKPFVRQRPTAANVMPESSTIVVDKVLHPNLKVNEPEARSSLTGCCRPRISPWVNRFNTVHVGATLPVDDITSLVIQASISAEDDFGIVSRPACL